MVLSIDLETYSPVDLKSEGVHNYVSHPDFEILMIAYKFDDGETQIATDDIPEEVENAIFDNLVLKTAANAAFEIACLEAHYGKQLDTSQWECTLILASMLGYPASLDTVGRALDLPIVKDTRGKKLIKYFCVPNNDGSRNLPSHDMKAWAEFQEYCITDVDVEYSIRQRLSFFKISQFERRLWVLDRKINNLGLMLDVQLAKQALALKDLNYGRLYHRAAEITGLENPNSPVQAKKWLSDQLSRDINSLDAEAVKSLLDEDLQEHVREYVEVRKEMGKTSLEKYATMLNMVGKGLRIRGLLQLYGASKTGRWAGRGVQIHNLTHTKLIAGKDYKEVKDLINDLSYARDIVKKGDIDTLEMLYGNVSSALSMLIRTAFVAPKGKDFTISDFNAIEARITAWFANEKWRVDLFARNGKIYEESAAMMYKIPVAQVDKSMRAKGKVAELALGYQGGVNAMERMGAIRMGLKQEELLPIVVLWRRTNPAIVRLWSQLNKAAVLAVKNPGEKFKVGKHLRFQVKHNTMFIQLPSGRLLSYVKPFLEEGQFGEAVNYWGLNDKNQWTVLNTYGGKLLENIVQATARDVLAVKMVALDEAGWIIPLHVHDEVVLETDLDVNVSEIDVIMSSSIDWAPGLPLAVASFRSPFYLKD